MGHPLFDCIVASWLRRKKIACENKSACEMWLLFFRLILCSVTLKTVLNLTKCRHYCARRKSEGSIRMRPWLEHLRSAVANPLANIKNMALLVFLKPGEMWPFTVSFYVCVVAYSNHLKSCHARCFLVALLHMTQAVNYACENKSACEIWLFLQRMFCEAE